MRGQGQSIRSLFNRPGGVPQLNAEGNLEATVALASETAAQIEARTPVDGEPAVAYDSGQMFFGKDDAWIAVGRPTDESWSTRRIHHADVVSHETSPGTTAVDTGILLLSSADWEEGKWLQALSHVTIFASLHPGGDAGTTETECAWYLWDGWVHSDLVSSSTFIRSAIVGTPTILYDNDGLSGARDLSGLSAPLSFGTTETENGARLYTEIGFGNAIAQPLEPFRQQISVESRLVRVTDNNSY